MPTDSSVPESITIPDLLQGSWTSLVILTYGANLGFLESRLLGQLAQIPLRLVLADDFCLEERLKEAAATGQRLRVNRAYVAAPIRHPRAAHAKAILLANATTGLLLVGSGNLGPEGYASPGELWHAFTYEESRPEHLSEFTAVRGLIEGLASRGSLDPPTQEVLREVWSRSAWLTEPGQELSTVRHNLEVPLAEQLAAEVNWKVEQLTAYAPFHDSECRALAWLVDRFKPRRLRILLRGDTSVDADRLNSVLTTHPNSKCMRVVVTDDPATYLHAKWVHLEGAKNEALLTGSSNLSRPAMLNSAESGNVELGVINHGPQGHFGHLYEPLLLETIEGPEALDVTYKVPAEPATQSDVPRLLWSRLDGNELTLMFDRPMSLETDLTILGSAGAIASEHRMVDDCSVRIRLSPHDATALTDVGRIEVCIGDESGGEVTWPYHLGSLLGRLDRAANRDLLSQAGDLPEADAELYELLQALESTLIFDPESAWRVAAPQTPPGNIDGDEQHLRWEELDWERIQRDPRYRGYHFRGATAGVPPTEIQVILAAISGKIGDLGDLEKTLGSSDLSADNESNLARESEYPSDAELESNEAQEETESRPLAIRTRTRMAFNRFVTRYAAAARDRGFVEKLGPILTVHNATIFNNLLIQLLTRDIVEPTNAIAAQIASWEMLWGTSDQPGLLERLAGDEREAAERVLAEADDRSTTLRALSGCVDYDLTLDLKVQLRGLVVRLLTDPLFELDAHLIEAAAPDTRQAKALVDNLESLACRLSDAEIAEFVVAPMSLTQRDTHWDTERIKRLDPAGGRSYDSGCATLMINRTLDDLNCDMVLAALERFVVATGMADDSKSYWRIKFSGNENTLGYWDAAANFGLSIVGNTEIEFDSLDVIWPRWFSRLQELSATVGEAGRRSA
jgi:hypothetical protein